MKRQVLLIGIISLVLGFFIGVFIDTKIKIDFLRNSYLKRDYYENTKETQSAIKEVLNRNDVSTWTTIFEGIKERNGNYSRSRGMIFTSCVSSPRFQFSPDHMGDYLGNKENGAYVMIQECGLSSSDGRTFAKVWMPWYILNGVNNREDLYFLIEKYGVLYNIKLGIAKKYFNGNIPTLRPLPERIVDF